ncbi:MAG: tyrosine-type recombinase/integrase [Planctomycetaceae bacterium]
MHRIATTVTTTDQVKIMRKRAVKPRKPYPDFPLTAHNNGQWCKKIRGKVHFFGVWDDPDAALQNYCDVRDDLQAGRQPAKSHGSTIRELVNSFLTRAKERHERSEISAKTFADYHMTSSLVVEYLGRNISVQSLRPTDFASFRHKLGQRYSVTALPKILTVIRMIFRWGYESEILDAPVRFGPDFKSPSKKSLRLHKASKGKKLFTAGEIQTLLSLASEPLKTMILLAINGGLGNTDVGTLTKSSLDLEHGWLEFPRRKTGIERRVPLWPETTEGLGQTDSGDSTLVFVTRNGNPYVWQRDEKSNDEVSKAFRRLLKRSNLTTGSRSFYALRHTFQTIGDEARDALATSAIMGHVDQSVAGQYREAISDERLRRVTDHVHDWLYKTVD